MPTKRPQDLLDLRHRTDKKASKPLMEKRRRARINHSLAQLKALVLVEEREERSSRQAKLEKADILELTVRHLHDIKRQQRTAFLLEDRHPKKKFEIGYSECAREVELFLSNLLDLDVEVRRRLKEHLDRRLQDFRSTEKRPKKDEVSDEDPSPSSEECFRPLPAEKRNPERDPEDFRSKRSKEIRPMIEHPKKDEVPDEDPSPSSDCFRPLPTDTEDSSDSSALNKMLKYYAGTRESEDFRPKRSKKIHYSKLTEADDRGSLPSSCHSVTSTTNGYRSSDVATAEQRHLRIVGSTAAISTRPVKRCQDRRSHFTNPPSPPLISAKHIADRKTLVPKCVQQQKTSVSCVSPTRSVDGNWTSEQSSLGEETKYLQSKQKDHSGCMSPAQSEGECRNQQDSLETKQIFVPDRYLKNNDSNRSGCISPSQLEDESKTKQSPVTETHRQIPLLPRRLSNGEWALVLPASSLVLPKEESQPFSAFRLVVPSDAQTDRRRPHSSSSTVSDTSCDEFYSRFDRIDPSSPDSSTQVVWRPW